MENTQDLTVCRRVRVTLKIPYEAPVAPKAPECWRCQDCGTSVKESCRCGLVPTSPDESSVCCGWMRWTVYPSGDHTINPTYCTLSLRIWSYTASFWFLFSLTFFLLYFPFGISMFRYVTCFLFSKSPHWKRLWTFEVLGFLKTSGAFWSWSYFILWY